MRPRRTLRIPPVHDPKLTELARLELASWKPPFRGTAMAVLFCFVHRLSTGNTFEETFNSNFKTEIDYQI